MKSVLKRQASKIMVLIIIFMFFTNAIDKETIKVRVYPLVRGIQHELILFKTKNFYIKETEHFVIKYDQEDPVVIDLVAKAAEIKYEEICNMFNYYPKQKITVIVYNKPQQLMNNANLKQGKPPMGVYYASTIQILSPRLWISDREDMTSVFMKEGPMIHEFTHLLVDDLTKGNYPLWFTEGIALYQEYVQTGYQWGKNLTFKRQPYTLKQLTYHFANLDEMLAYKQSFEMIKALIEKEGFHSLNQVLAALGEGKDFEKINEEIFGASMKEIYTK